jgi:acetate kinase
MNILVVNCGSSSVKADVIDCRSGIPLFQLKAERLQAQPVIKLNGQQIEYHGEYVLESVLKFSLHRIQSELGIQTVSGIGHRVAHGGDVYYQPVVIDEEVERVIEAYSELAPLHNPANLAGIKACREIFAGVPNVAVFDISFHQSIPNRAKYYAIDKSIASKYHIQRFGFHGTSHKYVSERIGEFLHHDIKNLRILSCHLGNGSSVCAIEFGRSIETSMGMTPAEGLVMGTRSGDIDPGIVTYLQKKEGWTPQQTEDFLNNRSGMAGLTGMGNDMRDILEKAEQGDEDCRLAIQVFTHRITKYIGAYTAVMGGLDVLSFTGGIGENSVEMRNRICQGLNFLGIKIDEYKNKSVRLSGDAVVANISDENSRVKVLAVRTDEQLAIALETVKIIEQKDKVNTLPKIPIAISARHVHLCRSTVDVLFGKGYELTQYRPLSQPGQFAANETVAVIGPKNRILNVRILGPLRAKDQVEISKTDEFFLGVDAPVRESGHIEGTPGITLEGPRGTTTIKEGVIVALRHIHMHPNDAEIFEVKDHDIVSVDVDDPDRPLTFRNVLIRVSEQFRLEMHIDTDEGNAAEIKPGEAGTLMKTEAKATLAVKNV